MLQGWRDAGGRVLFAVSTRSPVSRSVAWPAAAACKNLQRGRRWVGEAEGRLANKTTDIGEPFPFCKALPR